MQHFTVVPKEKSNELIKFWIEGVYVEGAYISAGITASYQCPEYLRKRFKKVDPKEPGVRINLEDKDNAFLITSTMAKEITGYTITVILLLKIKEE